MTGWLPQWPATASSAALSTPIGIPGVVAATTVVIRLRPQPVHNRPLAQAGHPDSLAGMGFEHLIGSTRARVGRCGAGGPAGSARVGRERVTR